MRKDHSTLSMCCVQQSLPSAASHYQEEWPLVKPPVLVFNWQISPLKHRVWSVRIKSHHDSSSEIPKWQTEVAHRRPQLWLGMHGQPLLLTLIDALLQYTRVMASQVGSSSTFCSTSSSSSRLVSCPCPFSVLRLILSGERFLVNLQGKKEETLKKTPAKLLRLEELLRELF